LAKQDTVKFFGLDRQYASIREEVLDTIDKVLSSGNVLDGPYINDFEESIAAMTGRNYAVAVNSGTQALLFAQQVLKSKPKRILIPTLSFIATLNSVLMANNTPVFCDVDEQGLMNLFSLNTPLNHIDTGLVDAIMYVNIFGNTVDWDKFHMAAKFFGNDIPIIEDAAQSLGASYKGTPSGKLGDISILSFDPTKNLPNYGSGGMVLTDNVEEYIHLKDIRNNGKYDFNERTGTNSKMSELDAAVMLIKLKEFPKWQKRRTDIAEYYTQELSDYMSVPQITEGCVPSWHKYVVKHSDRNLLIKVMASHSIETKIHYDTPLYDVPVGFTYINYATDLYPGVTRFTHQCLSLPIYPEMTDYEVERVVIAAKSGAV
jgi:dTDP-4-amino-4,6-dideoxygalactose transaminase